MNEAPAIGIDLGTTYSCVAIMQNEKVVVIANDLGNRIIPSCVSFTEHGRITGEAALNQMSSNPINTVYDVKRLVGRLFNDPSVQKNMKNWPFIVKCVDNKPKIAVHYKNELKEYSPEEISSMILIKMKEIAESYVGQAITDAVITVPANFNYGQRQATKNSGIIAGLNITRIISEPTAAAIAYHLDNKDNPNQKVLVYDLGGGTFDVTIFLIENGELDLKVSIGDNHLGGQDLTNRLVNHLLQEFSRKHDMYLETDKRSLHMLRNICERTKRILSQSTLTTIAQNAIYKGIDFYSTITRECFEDLNADLFKKTIDMVEKAIYKAKMNKTEIDEIVLVGGSCQIPKIQALLQEFFEGKEPKKSINPEEIVACGAAIQAAICRDEAERLSRKRKLDDFREIFEKHYVENK